jgi:hypothetical protein
MNCRIITCSSSRFNKDNLRGRRLSRRFFCSVNKKVELNLDCSNTTRSKVLYKFDVNTIKYFAESLITREGLSK